MRKAIFGMWLLLVVLITSNATAQETPTTVPLLKTEKAIIFNGGEGVGYYILFLEEGEGTVLVVRCDSLVTGTGTPNPKPPTDTPPEEPEPKPEPKSKYGLKEQVAGWFNNVQGSTKKEEAVKLSMAFFTTVAGIVNGDFGTEPVLAKVGASLNKLNQKAVPDAERRTAWRKPFFEDGFGKAINELVTSGKIKTQQEYAEAFQEIYIGLAEVK